MTAKRKWRISNRVLWTIAALSFILSMATSCLLASKLADSASGYANTIDLLTASATSSELTESSATAAKAKQPAFQVIDENGVWSTSTEINIFKSIYYDSEGNPTVMSSDGEHIIAPGTSASYNWSLYNKGDVSLTYTMTLSCLFYGLPSNIDTLPIEFRLAHEDGWVFGSSDTWVSGDYLHSAVLMGAIDAGRYDNYRLDWRWAFEYGQDELDTMLGNAAAYGDEDLGCAINIDVRTEADTGASKANMSTTSDKFRMIAIAGGLLIISGAAVGICIWRMRKERDGE